MMKDQWEELSALFPKMVSWRRHLHQHPELSYQEKNTSNYVAELLEQWGIETRKGHTDNWVIGVIAGELPGPTIALRADMDALPIQDEKVCDYASKSAGVMHACGHDAHTATLLGLGSYFSSRRELLTGTILLVFQHAEELSPGGAKDILSSGLLDEADVIYGVHLWTPLPVGNVYSAPGAIMAAADEFNIHIKGKGGHGGLPHATVDSIHIAAQTIVGLQSIVSRNVDPIEPCVVSIGVIQAGSAFNVIAEQCEMIGTVRSFNEDVRELTEKRMKEIVESTASIYGGHASFEFVRGYPPVVNDVVEASRFNDVAFHAFGAERVHTLKPIMAGEDFAYYLQRIPGCFMLVGAGNEELGIVHPHHHPKFDIDESAMLQAAQLLTAMAEDYMRENSNVLT